MLGEMFSSDPTSYETAPVPPLLLTRKDEHVFLLFLPCPATSYVRGPVTGYRVFTLSGYDMLRAV